VSVAFPLLPAVATSSTLARALRQRLYFCIYCLSFPLSLGFASLDARLCVSVRSRRGGTKKIDGVYPLLSPSRAVVFGESFDGVDQDNYRRFVPFAQATSPVHIPGIADNFVSPSRRCRPKCLRSRRIFARRGLAGRSWGLQPRRDC
jgi:hypothetical protein